MQVAGLGSFPEVKLTLGKVFDTVIRPSDGTRFLRFTVLRDLTAGTNIQANVTNGSLVDLDVTPGGRAVFTLNGQVVEFNPNPPPGRLRR